MTYESLANFAMLKPGSIHKSWVLDFSGTSNTVETNFEGSHSNPIEIEVNSEFPKQTKHGFKGIYVPTMKYHSITRPAFCVSKEYFVIDAEDVKAQMPGEHKFQKYKDWCFLVAKSTLGFVTLYPLFYMFMFNDYVSHPARYHKLHSFHP